MKDRPPINYPTGFQPIKRTNEPSKVQNASNRTRGAKYGNIKTKVDGIVFDSKAEATYYKLNRHIPRMKMQVAFELIPGYEFLGKKYRKTEYIADFVFYDEKGEILKVVDVKGMQTKEFKLKAKMLVYKYKIPLVLAEYDSRTGLFEEKIF